MDTSDTSQDRVIVVGVDGSPPAERALLWAAREAARTSSTLRIVHAWSIPAMATWPAYSTPYIDRGEIEQVATSIVADAAGLVSRTLGHLSPDLAPTTVEGPAVGALLDAARGSTLLVVGSRGRSELAGAVLGSVSAGCAHHTPVPLVVIRDDAPAMSGGDLVVGYDGSPVGAEALRWAVELAATIDAKVRVLHAWSPDLAMPFGGLPDGPPALDMTDRGPAAERAVADAVRGIDPLPPLSVEVVPLPAARALLEEAVGATALVVGTHGHGGFAGMLLGSVSNHCLHHSPCPLVIVPATPATVG